MDKPEAELGSLGQIGVVVKDIEKVMKYYTETFGIGPWHQGNGGRIRIPGGEANLAYEVGLRNPGATPVRAYSAGWR